MALRAHGVIVVGLSTLVVVLGTGAARSAAAEEAVPNVVGLEAEAAKKRIVDAGFRYVLERVEGHEANQVFAQAPAGGSRRAKGTAIYIRVGTGKATPSREPAPEPNADRWRLADRKGPPLPSTIGLLEAEARKALGRWQVRREETVGIPDLEGRAVLQAPAPGEPLAEGETVVVVVARTTLPPGTQATPRVIGQKGGDARKVLTSHGFRALVRQVEVPPAKAGEVYAQQPLPGSLLEKGGTVYLAVGVSAPKPDPDPTTAPGPTLKAPTLISPSEGQRYPRDYAATFRWKPVPGAEAYEWVLERFAPAGAWTRAAAKTSKAPAHRILRQPAGSYRWRVRAAHDAARGAWSPWFRLFFQ